MKKAQGPEGFGFVRDAVIAVVVVILLLISASFLVLFLLLLGFFCGSMSLSLDIAIRAPSSLAKITSGRG
jgi:hypothetical protein